MRKLSVKRVAATRKPGMYGDGDGLYLRVGPTGAKSWILRTLVHGRRRESGLGSLAWMSLAEAREEARKLRTEARSGRDPDLLRKREELSFEEAGKRHHASLSSTLKSDRHAELWLRSLELYALPKIGKRPIQSITTTDVLSILNPIWAKKHDTARRVKQRNAAVFDWAKGAGHYPHENPVAGLKKALPAVKRKAEHMAARGSARSAASARTGNGRQRAIWRRVGPRRRSRPTRRMAMSMQRPPVRPRAKP